MFLIKRQVSAPGMKRRPFKPFCHYREIHSLALFIFINSASAALWSLYRCTLYSITDAARLKSSYVKSDSSQHSVCLTRADPYRAVQSIWAYRLLLFLFFLFRLSRAGPAKANEKTSVALWISVLAVQTPWLPFKLLTRIRPSNRYGEDNYSRRTGRKQDLWYCIIPWPEFAPRLIKVCLHPINFTKL